MNEFLRLTEVLKDAYGGTCMALAFAPYSPSWADYRKARKLDEAKLHEALRARDSRRASWLRETLAHYDRRHWPMLRRDNHFAKYLRGGA